MTSGTDGVVLSMGDILLQEMRKCLFAENEVGEGKDGESGGGGWGRGGGIMAVKNSYINFMHSVLQHH